jgi:hypothetical protein
MRHAVRRRQQYNHRSDDHNDQPREKQWANFLDAIGQVNREKCVDHRRAAKNQRHHVNWFAPKRERQNDAKRADSPHRPACNAPNQAGQRPFAFFPPVIEPHGRHDHAD